MNKTNNDLQEILTHAIEEIRNEMGTDFDINKINLKDLENRTGITRARLRRYKNNEFIIPEHGNKGKKKENTVISSYEENINYFLSLGVTNSSVIFDNLKGAGYKGSLTSVKNYISSHMHLVPAKRKLIVPQGNRGRRYSSEAGECYQMDWGFVNVITPDGSKYQVACFAMICHHCGKMYVEFFPNARQESLFIGMIHAFAYMGIPEYVLTENMKSVVISRDSNGNPIFQKDYEVFMKNLIFKTKLCKSRHPFTKGKVERLVRFVKENFIAGRVFGNISDLNCSAISWCNDHNGRYHRSLDMIPEEEHRKECLLVARELIEDSNIRMYLSPLRKISFDGFVNYEGRRFGVPYYYSERTCRILRDGFYIYIYDSSLAHLLTKHNVTWSRKDSFCIDQYALKSPEEVPSVPVRAMIHQAEEAEEKSSFSRFNFSKAVNWDE